MRKNGIVATVAQPRLNQKSERKYFTPVVRVLFTARQAAPHFVFSRIGAAYRSQWH
jgi:hypothetical protein